MLHDLDGGNIFVYGFSADGRRSTLRAANLSAGRNSRGPQEIRVGDGGLIDAGRLYLSTSAGFSGSISTLTVSGVNANGTRSTVDTQELSGGRFARRVAFLHILDGGLVRAADAGFFSDHSAIVVAGTAAGGQRSSLLISRDGLNLDKTSSLTVTGGGLMQGRFLHGGIVSVSGANSVMDFATLDSDALPSAAAAWSARISWTSAAAAPPASPAAWKERERWKLEPSAATRNPRFPSMAASCGSPESNGTLGGSGFLAGSPVQ